MTRGFAFCLLFLALFGLFSVAPHSIEAGETPEETEAVVAATEQGAAEVDEATDEHEEDDDDDHRADFESLLQMMSKDMHMDLANNDMAGVAKVLKELTDHIDAAHKHDPEAHEHKHPLLKKILTKRTHDKMVTTLQKIYSNVPREEINDQLQAVMSLLEHVKQDPNMSPKQLLEKTAHQLGMPLTPDMYEDMQKHMGWAAKLFQYIAPGGLDEEKAEEL
ncbi:hypothetical protein TGPRC2_310790 [Toxoplasma gondii TgCatPRC2]|uniref:Transmembrane protein n=12 Tax=Toxoplasma gondii TaxID=5811 RepID=S7UTU9_TOXGG|nr:hypothetical protein TGGT1_310790 [Toxoplasma gondii GT1]KAF4639258.1 hypothetical protein TGRH88_050300 [Toxoplasma gondii]KFG40957.1 hypothetical protein TGP89_310790 [Toxoplasma gondii p89]KFG44468.1 hypothetical protein TGDOM2_310790 [Toxoplasma gondii GAB2-2007-GAL-DOM2]KFG55853.1 hypothetical protein TGFOU_310790 [Toxoplasma gondii FOU]KFG65852.1 hypothetical protein TGRUB_310790 [Toxoplasma gondii RUB]KFH02314.1 hypothetical protein TGVAND_310790 [Toxoplasma gondii VAND]KFH18061.1 